MRGRCRLPRMRWCPCGRSNGCSREEPAAPATMAAPMQPLEEKPLASGGFADAVHVATAEATVIDTSFHIAALDRLGARAYGQRADHRPGNSRRAAGLVAGQCVARPVTALRLTNDAGRPAFRRGVLTLYTAAGRAMAARSSRAMRGCPVCRRAKNACWRLPRTCPRAPNGLAPRCPMCC